jgi:hypothetical protein
MQVTVKDKYGNLVAGASVTFVAQTSGGIALIQPASGPSGSFAGQTSVTVATNSLGVATAPTFTANTVAGSYVVTSTVSGVSSAASFSLTNTAGAAATIVTTAGTPQSATVATNFGTTMQVTAKDKYGNLVAGASVTFTAPTSGAGGSFAAGKTVTVTTNSLGVATAPTFTAGTVAGSYVVTATVAGISAASFSLTNTAGAATTIVTTAGTSQSAVVATNFGTAMQVTVKDKYGNLVGGVSVTFAAPTSGADGAFSGKSTVTVTTNSLGVAIAPTFTAGTVAGSYSVKATVAGVTSSASFNLTNTAGAAATIVTTAGTPQSAAVGKNFGTAMQVKVEDKYGNAVAGVSVTFTAPTSSPTGAFSGKSTVTVTTNSLGVAIAPTFTAGTRTGSYSVKATVAGVSSSASFNLTNIV